MQTIIQHIPLVLKELRQQKGWSLDKAAQATGVSKAMLGQIERGESSPTITTLWKIASGFQVAFSELIEGPKADLKQGVSSKPSHKFNSKGDKIQILSLFPFDPILKLEIFIIKLHPKAEHLSPPHEAGVIEHVITTDKAMDVLVNDKWQTIKKGAGLRFKADMPHGYRNKSTISMSFISMVCYPDR